MCKEKEITVLKVRPHKKPEVVTLKNEWSPLQEAVSSGVKDYHHLIQLVGAEEGVDVLLNDEGTFLSRPRSAGSLCWSAKFDSGRKKVPKPLAWEPFSHRRAIQRIKGEVHKEVWKRSFQIRLRISAPMALQPTSWQFSCMMSPQRKPERSVLSTARSMASASAAMSKL